MRRKTPERSQERSRRDPTQTRLLRILVLALLLLQAVASFFPGPSFWGVSHLAYAAPAFRILWPLLGIFLILTSAGNSFGRWLTNRLSPMLLGQPLAAYVALPIVGALLFWLLRCRTYFLGDGWLLGELVAAGIRFHGFDFIHYHLMARIAGTLAHPVDTDAFRLFAGTSIIAGVLYLAAAAWSARNLSKDEGERVLLYLLLVFCAPVEMFMGYVECYSILAVFMLLFAATIALHYLNRLPVWVPAIAFGLGLAFHLNALFLAPLLLVLIFWPAGHAPRSVWKRLASVALPVVGAAALAAIFYLLEGYNRSNFETDFVKSRQTQRLLVTLLGSGGFLSWRHWKDVLNLLLLVAPVPLVMLLAAIAGGRTAGGKSGGLDARESSGADTNKRSANLKKPDNSGQRALITLLAGSLWLVLLMSLLHMKLGIARDWDLLAAQTPVFVLAAFLTWSKLARGRPGFGLVGVVATGVIFLSLPWFLVNASETRPVQRFKDMIADQPGFSQAYAHEELGKYYRKRGMTREALSEYETAARLFPDNARFYVVLGGLQYNSGLHDDALQSFNRALQVDSTFVWAFEMVARIHAERNEFEQALVYARKLASTPKENSNAAALHGMVAERLGLYDEALRAYETAVEKNPLRSDLTERIAALQEKTRVAPGQPGAR